MRPAAPSRISTLGDAEDRPLHVPTFVGACQARFLSGSGDLPQSARPHGQRGDRAHCWPTLARRLHIVLAVAMTLGMRQAIGDCDAYLDGLPAPNGGQLRAAGPFHLELVVRPTEIIVYVTDHGGKPVPTEKATASVTVSNRTTGTSVVLSPAGGNALNGQGRFSVDADTKVVVTLSLGGSPPAEFWPGRRAAAPAVHAPCADPGERPRRSSSGVHRARDSPTRTQRDDENSIQLRHF